MGRTKFSRSSQFRNKPEPVSELDSRPPSSSETTTDTSVSESSAPKKSPTPSERLSSSPSSPSSQSDEATGELNSVNHTQSHAKCTPNADPSICDSSQSQKRSWPTLDTLTFTPVPKVAPLLSET